MRSVVTLLSLALLTAAAVAGAEAQVRPRRGQRVVEANRFPGADLGAKINAADRELGASPGEIVVRGGGVIATQVVLSEGHTLRLLAGTYAPRTQGIPVLMKPRTAVVGAGWDSILLESTAPNQFTVIAAFNGAQRNGAADSDLLIRDLQVKGANPGFHSAPQAIALGNCSRCTVDNVWVNGTRSIGIQLGGSSREGHFAADSRVVNCLFTRVASQNLALVNGRNITFENNRFLRPGQRGGPGTTSIDLEPNEPQDRLQNVLIRNNTIDHRDSEMPVTGNGIVVQATSGTPHVGPIVVEGNTLIGGSITGTITNMMSNGIYVFGQTMRDVVVRNNQITRTGQAGLNLEGRRLTVENNRLKDVGGGGTPGFIVTDVFDSRLVNNTFEYSGAGPADGRISVRGSTRGTVIENNRGFTVERARQ